MLLPTIEYVTIFLYRLFAVFFFVKILPCNLSVTFTDEFIGARVCFMLPGCDSEPAHATRLLRATCYVCQRKAFR